MMHKVEVLSELDVASVVNQVATSDKAMLVGVLRGFVNLRGDTLVQSWLVLYHSETELTFQLG